MRVFCVFRPSEFELLPVQVAAFEFSDGLNNLKFWVGGFSVRFQVSMGVCRLKVFGKAVGAWVHAEGRGLRTLPIARGSRFSFPNVVF